MEYRIKGLGRPLDGLIVTASDEDVDICGGVLKENMLYAVRLPNMADLDADEFCVWGDNLEESVDKRERQVNPNGEYRGDTRIKRYNLEAVLVEYKKLLTVTILEHEHEDGKYNSSGRDIVHTRYTQNYYKNIGAVKEAVEKAVMLGDLDDLIFDLKALVEK